jgi:hypothetical protein
VGKYTDVFRRVRAWVIWVRAKDDISLDNLTSARSGPPVSSTGKRAGRGNPRLGTFSINGQLHPLEKRTGNTICYLVRHPDVHALKELWEHKGEDVKRAVADAFRELLKANDKRTQRAAAAALAEIANVGTR